MVCVFLIWVVVPLFSSAKLADNAQWPTTSQTEPLGAIQLGMDEYAELGWALFADGNLRLFRLADGHQVGGAHEIRGAETGDQQRMSAWAFGADGSTCAFGFADGTVRLGSIGFKTKFMDAKDVPSGVRNLRLGEMADLEGGMVAKTSENQFRLQTLEVALDPPTPAVSASAIVKIAFATRSEGPIFCALSADGKVNVNSVEKQHNFVTDEDTLSVDTVALPPLAAGASSPSHVLISGLGDNVILAWDDGRLLRYDIRNFHKPRVAEQVHLLESPDARITAIRYLLGGSTLIVGDSAGNTSAWFGIKPQNAHTPDGVELVKAHEFPGNGSAITALAVSSRSRTVAVGAADGRVNLLFVTSERVMAQATTGDGQPVQAIALAPKSDVLMAASSKGMTLWNVKPGYPEITLSTLFRPIWYEGYPGPSLTWQSSSGSDAFEPKFGLMPLIFGTLKGTFYAMLFAVPLAILAAVYTSEFLVPRARAAIKPAIEVMASLPSVVLGFLAGLMIAPAIESIVPAILATFLTVPFMILLVAHLWQLLPANQAGRMARWRFVAIILVLPVGVGAGILLGPVAERLLFDGDLKAWLNGRVGTATPGWFVILLPLAALAAMMLMRTYVNPWLGRAARLSRKQAGLIELGKFIVGSALTLLLSWIAAALLGSLSIEPRGLIVGTYVQRNALVVGLMMAFAVIPLIYTLADDALASVPNHLRSASLATGATHWQTAVRIVIPTAMSGLFSAVIIGLGRAVGETMIVLMATGNTPIMDWNIFNGFQTLSATIATELPEAPRGGTHFRTLFFAALALFVLTFVVNTAAEIIRQRYRRRAYEL
jgi:phosphate transport system permease protein